MNWKPIDDDAKRLHDAILGGPGWVKVGWWCARCGAFHPRGDLSETLEPTHYQEFPDPPAGERERRYPKPKPLDADRLEHVLMAVGISTSNTAERELRRHIAYLEAAEAGLQTMVEQAEDRANALAAELTAVKTAYAAAAQAREEERGRVAELVAACRWTDQYLTGTRNHADYVVAVRADTIWRMQDALAALAPAQHAEGGKSPD